jgi:hypothetical protein
LLSKVVAEADDGIVPVDRIQDEPSALDLIRSEFERVFGEQADSMLSDVDSILGDRPADDNPFPNVQAWTREQAFAYHLDKSDRSPTLWRLTTRRLVSDPVSEGFACFVDFHSLESNLIDRLQNHYLEPRKADLRERRSAANRRRNDDSLSTAEQSEAAEKYKRCENSLQQITLFEETLADLAQPSPREWPQENQEIAAKAAKQVAEFRKQTASRLETLGDLATCDDVDMEDLFSPSFYETVQENQDEWLDALGDLETAFEAYAEDGSERVDAHLYDLFEYYDDLIGSAHYASNGILFMTYYFDKFEGGQSQIGDSGISKRHRLLSELATELDEYKELADGIADACDEISTDIPSDWIDRALSEITTVGYQPNLKHGVEINVRPLADAEIIPKAVDDKVL